jgi:hypothetical protein
MRTMRAPVASPADVATLCTDFRSLDLATLVHLLVGHVHEDAGRTGPSKGLPHGDRQALVLMAGELGRRFGVR